MNLILLKFKWSSYTVTIHPVQHTLLYLVNSPPHVAESLELYNLLKCSDSGLELNAHSS